MSRGEDFRQAIRGNVIEDPTAQVALDLLCGALDRLERLQAIVESDGYTVTGSTGQSVAHPLLKEIRSLEAAVAKLLDDFIPANDDTRTPSQRAAHAARTRWQRQREGV